MTVLTPPRHPTVDTALVLARRWCRGQRIDGSPALAHAVKVALTVARHLPDPPPALLAAALLHDSPEFAPPDVDLDATLDRLDPQVTRIVRALEAEHNALDGPGDPPVPVGDVLLLVASAADKVVALGSMLARAAAAPDPEEFWRRRAAFLDLRPYFRRFHTEAHPHLPAGLAAELGIVVTAVERVCATGRN